MSLWRLRDQNRTEANTSDAGGPVWGDHLLKGSEDKQEGKSWVGGSHCSQRTASKLLGEGRFLREDP